jgi:tRNA pseudouridine38-40 synthase
VGKDLARRTAVLVGFGYDGARFFGLQPQPGLPTAGGALQARLHAAAGAAPRGLAFAARTDRGVHAGRNLATCWWLGPLDVDAVAAAVAAPRDDGLIDVDLAVVPPTVHARGVSRGKHYRYRVVDSADGAALDDRRAWRVVPTLDVADMAAAARHLRGRHDFSSLRGGGCTAASAEKTLFVLDVVRAGDGAVVIDIVGDAFVRHMVRNLVGLLVEVGCGLRRPDDVVAVLAARHRQAAGLMAPGAGLTLVAVGSAWPPDGSGRLPGTPADDDLARDAVHAGAVVDEG